jgi:HSP20 family protein
MKLTKQPRTMPFKTDVERLFDRVLEPLGFELPAMQVLETAWTPSVDLTESDKEFVVRLEVPGVHKENMDIGLEGNILTITGRREFRKDEETEEYIWREREEGKFVRSLRLPKPVEGDKVVAAYENGILTVRLPKLETTVKSRISIK